MSVRTLSLRVDVGTAVDHAADALEARLTVPRDRAGATNVATDAVVPATDLDLWQVHVRFARTRGADDRAVLIRAYADHARQLARRFYRNWEPLEDLQQVALEGLLLAIDRFDPSRSRPFLGFANPTIIGSLKRFYRDAGWTIRVPRRVHELSRPLRDAWESLTQDLGRTPTAAEIADLVGVTHEVIEAALVAESLRSTGSLEATGADESSLDALSEPDHDLELAENRHALRQSMQVLPDEDVLLLQLYFRDELTQAEIASRLGVSQMQVSRNLSRILSRLRSHLP